MTEWPSLQRWSKSPAQNPERLARVLARISEEVRSQVSTLSDQFASTDFEALLTASESKIVEPSQAQSDQSQQA